MYSRNRGQRSNESWPAAYESPFASNSNRNSSQNFPSLDSGRNVGIPLRNAEQLAFELEFTKWETGFEQWKRDFADHPDKDAYRQYESKFLEVREKLLLKKRQLFAPEPVAKQFESHFSAATALAESILEKFNSPFDQNSGGGRSQDSGRQTGPVWDQNYGGQNQNFGGQLGNLASLMSLQLGNQMNSQANNYGMSSRYQNNFSSQINSMPAFGGSPFNNQMNSMSLQFGYQMQSQFGNQRQMPSGQGRNFISNNRNDSFRGNRQGNNNKKKKDESYKLNEEKYCDPKKVYPNVRWTLMNTDKPPLVGKRKKKLNNKIQTVLEIKAGVANLDKRLEELRKTTGVVCVNGSAIKKYRDIRAKPEDEYTEYDKKFIEYYRYIKTRQKGYKARETTSTETSLTETTQDTKPTFVENTKPTFKKIENQRNYNDNAEIDRKFALARNTIGEVKISGAARRRSDSIKAKKEEHLTATDRKFLEYYSYLRLRREQWRDKLKGKETQSGETTASLMQTDEEMMGEPKAETTSMQTKGGTDFDFTKDDFALAGTSNI